MTESLVVQAAQNVTATWVLLALVSLLTTSCVLSYARSTAKAVTSPLSKLPGPWYAPYWNGHLQLGFATGNIWKTVEKAHKTYGSYVRLGPRQVWISDRDAMKEILLTKDLPKVRMYAEISRDRFSPGLFGEVRPVPHKQLRKFLHNAFTVGYVDGLDNLFQEPTQALMKKYAQHVSSNVEPTEQSFDVDLMDDLHKLALDIMGECALGRGFGATDPNVMPEPGIDPKVWKKIPKAVFESTRKRYRMVYWKRFLRSWGINAEFDWSPEMVGAIEKVVQRRQSAKENERHDLLQHLIDEGRRADNNKKMEARDILDQMSEIMLAGSETTSGTIACFCLEMVRNPDVQAKLLQSLPVLSPNDEIIGGKQIREDPNYTYLNACIKENLRIHPIASEMGRTTGAEEVTLGEHTFPAGTVISASYRTLHHNPEFWPETDRFWPERFLPKELADDAPPADMSAYYPFSAGAHSCIGMNFAWSEMRVLLGNLFSRFELEEVKGQTIDFRQYITMQFDTGSWHARLKPRWSKSDE